MLEIHVTFPPSFAVSNSTPLSPLDNVDGAQTLTKSVLQGHVLEQG
jgi:hypothetical protein